MIPSPSPNRLLLALSFALGVWLAQQWVELPGWPELAAAWLGLLGWGIRRQRRGLLLAAVLLGLAWALSCAAWRLPQGLPAGLEGRDMAVDGTIASLPERFSRGWRFDFAPDSAAGLPQRLRLSWYDSAAAPKAGESWHLQLRLKAPHGVFNPGGFDFERWLFARGIAATGYVRPGDNRRLAAGSAWSPEVWRQYLADRVDAVLAERPCAGLVRALVIGDESGVDQAQWQVLRATGTAHLVAISGSHISLVAGLVFWLAARLCAHGGLQRWPPPAVAALAGLLAALSYTALAGFAIPARRALIMAAVALGAVLGQRHLRLADGLALALFLVLLHDPWAVLAPGFYLSFASVALIFLLVAGRVPPLSGWNGFFRANWATSLGLAPWLLLLFQQAPWVAPLANLLAIPVMGLLAVPLSLGGTLLLLLGLDADGLLLQGTEWLLRQFWPFLQWLAAGPPLPWPTAIPPFWTLALAGLAALLALLPRGLPGRWLALPLLLPAFTWQPAQPTSGGFRLSLLDVGQGLSVVVRTAGHTLVYDAGPRFDAELDSGRNVVEPFLRATGTAAIDILLASHGDNDHIGGVFHLLDSLPVAQLYTSVPQRLQRHSPLPCWAGQRWQWDGVDFSLLSPPMDKPGYEQGSENNRSCVLKIAGPYGSALLPGDIERETEARLLREYGAQLASTLLIVPHHGSRTSSSPGFLAAVQPQTALFPSGYRNRFHFPHPEVLERYRRLGIRTEQTGLSGTLTQEFGPNGLRLQRHRDQASRYWNWRPRP